ncbi:MAG: hypothetical protein GZ088_14330 [Acidipila sp.]|nr:hypothetical protein [Acidipila sp.]
MHETPYKRPEEIIDEPQEPRRRKEPEIPDPSLPGDPSKQRIDHERRKGDIQPPPDSPDPIPNGPEISYDAD